MKTLIYKGNEEQTRVFVIVDGTRFVHGQKVNDDFKSPSDDWGFNEGKKSKKASVEEN